MRSMLSENNFAKVGPFQSLIFIVLITFTGFLFIGSFLGIAAAIPFYDGSISDMYYALNDPVSHPDLKIPLFIMQGFSTFIGFILFPYLYCTMVLKLGTRDFTSGQFPTPVISLLVVILVVTFMGANSIFIEWNANLTLPQSLSGLERWARDFEDRAQEITQFLTTFESGSEFIIGLIVIAILPAIGEELVFRGLIQTHLNVITRNIHISIWVSAIIFSFFHMQFFGFVPRILLGALFGYLYAWSGNLSYPVIAHSMNNGFTLFMMYLYSKGNVDFDIEATESVPLTTVLISAGITAVLLYIFKSYFRNETVQNE